MCFSSYAQLVFCFLPSFFRTYPYIRGRQPPGHRLVDDHDALTTAFRLFFFSHPSHCTSRTGCPERLKASCTIFCMLLLHAGSCFLTGHFMLAFCILHHSLKSLNHSPVSRASTEYCTHALHVFPPYVTIPCGLLLDFSCWNILVNFTSMQRAAFVVFCHIFGGSWHVLVPWLWLSFD